MRRPAWTRRKFIRQRLLIPLGYDPVHWTRVVQYRECFTAVRSFGPERLDVLEISAGSLWRDSFAFKSFTGTQFPDYDIEAKALDASFDLIIADHVLICLDRPAQGIANMRKMLRPGGHCIVTTPFLVRAHLEKKDNIRWTESGLANVMVEGGFERDKVRTDAWGNRACVVANFRRWPAYGFGWFKSLRNEPDFPVSVWAIAER
jgi:SAM-dependent methyltransferase